MTDYWIRSIIQDLTLYRADKFCPPIFKYAINEAVNILQQALEDQKLYGGRFKSEVQK